MERACGAGGKCGSCRNQIKGIITETRAADRPAASKRHSILPMLVMGG